jgi:SAM-dependent methyltransferase
MKPVLLDYLACPRCAGDLSVEDEKRDGDDVAAGMLVCSKCGERHPIVRGIPRMNVDMAGLENVARTFGYEWKTHHQGGLEDETLFGRTLDEDWDYFQQAFGITNADLQGKSYLDAGCGSGRPTRQVAEHGAGIVIGMDVNEAVDEAAAFLADLDNVHIVQGNVFAPPFKEGVFDFVWSQGVLHHTPDPARGHAALAKRVKPGGRMYIWVYAKRFNPFRWTKDVFDALRISRLPEPVLLRIARAISYPSWALLQVYRAIRRLPGLQPKGKWGKNTVKPRSIAEFQLTWFDALSPEFDSRHTDAEVKGWYSRAGFVDVEAIDEPKVGVRGRAPESAGVGD